jgi:hypothetical protein
VTERVVFAFGVGAVCLSTLVFGLCAIGMARTPWLVGASSVVIAGAVVHVCGAGLRPARGLRPRSWRAASPPQGAALPHQTARSTRWLILCWIIAVPFAIVYLVNAAAPEISPDGTYYHLGVVRQYFNHGGFFRWTNNLYASFPQGCEMLFLVAYAIGRHSAAALVHCAFLFALPAALIAYGRRFELPTAGIIAALLVFVSPVVGIDGSSAYVDVALAFTGFSCFYALELWSGDTGNWPLLIVAGLLAGFCFAIKYTGFMAIVLAAGFVLWRHRAGAPVVLAAAALVAAPWLIKNWIVVDNPVSPFLNRLFPNPYIYISFEEEYVSAMRHFNGQSLGWRTPFELTVGGGLLQGTLGPAFLLALLGLAALTGAHGRRILFAAALFALPWFSNIGTRMLLPALPFIALAMGIALARAPRWSAAFVVLNAVACWPWVLSRYCAPYNWHVTRFPLNAALRITPEHEFLDGAVPEIRYARLIQDRVPAGGVVYTAQPIMESYTDRTILLNYAAALNNRIGDTLNAAFKPDHQPSRRVVFEFPPAKFTKARIVTTGGAPMWTVHEIEGGTPRTVANPNHWDAFLAGDGRLVTSWRSWQKARPGMLLEFEFPDNAERTSIAYRTRDADPVPPQRLEVLLPTGEWRVASEAPRIEAGVPVPELRAGATAELRRAGVTHLLIHDDEPLGPDFRAHERDWNVRLTGEALPLRLYAILPDSAIDTGRDLRNNTK